MVLLKFFSKILLILPFSIVLLTCSKKTDEEIYIYKGEIECSQFPELKERIIYIDPGHGGLGKSDLFRMSKQGEYEEAINLRVSLILYDMLKKAGAWPILSRYTDVDIDLDERARHIKEAQPELLISVHHNGSARAADGVNYATVFVHATKETNPQSYDFAELLKAEFKKATNLYCNIVSDFAIFNESGMRILRLTRNVCPGVIGEFGFFSDERFSLLLADINFNTKEAEAYFRAICEYFRRGMPTAEIGVRAGNYYIKIKSGNDTEGIEQGSLFVTLDDVKLDYTKIAEDVYRIEAGEIFPGGHRFVINFKNTSGQSSPLYYHTFRKSVSKGVYDRLVSDGMRLIKTRSNVKRGTKMLLSALSLGTSDPNAKNLMLNIAEGFRLMGDMHAHEYYYKSANSFFPDLDANNTRFGFPIKYYGTKIKVGRVEDFFR